jgi:hypothetical protein
MAVRGAIAGAPKKSRADGRVGKRPRAADAPTGSKTDPRSRGWSHHLQTLRKPPQTSRSTPWGRCRCIGRKVRRQAVHGSDRRHARAFSVARSSCSAAIVSARLCSNGIFGVQPSSRLALALDATLSLPSEAPVSCVVKMRGAPSVLALNHSNRDRSAAFASTAPISGVPHPTPCVHWEGSL